MAGTENRLGGRYRLGELLGHGGTADVHRARDEELGCDVAVKIFRSADFEESDRDRFRVEVGALATLQHPHLVPVLDAGVDDERPWCAMHLLDGGTFAALPKPVPVARLARIGAEIAAALAYVHERGIVHRDVKQSNIILDARGRAYLSDFGSARIVNVTGPTLTGRLIGTAAYLSPEQVEGLGATSASDVYALGLVLLEGFTGEREYPGNAIESAVARLSRAPRIPDTLPRPLGRLLRELTATEPARRPSALAVVARLAGMDLDGAAGSATTRTLRAFPLPRPRRPARRRHDTAGRQVVTVLTAAAAGALITAVGSWRLAADPEVRPSTPVAVATSKPAAPRSTVDAVRAAAAVNTSKSRSATQTANSGKASKAVHPRRPSPKQDPKPDPKPGAKANPKPSAAPGGLPGKDRPAAAVLAAVRVYDSTVLSATALP